MDLPIHIDTISVGLPIVQVKGSQIEFSKLHCIRIHTGCISDKIHLFSKNHLPGGNSAIWTSVFKVVLILANSADPDEIQHNAAFHPGLHCLPMYTRFGFPVYTRQIRRIYIPRRRVI